MATIEFIKARIAGKEKEIVKLEKKLARIEKAQASGWEDNPYYYCESDLKYTKRDLEAARKSLAAYQAQLQEATEKAESRNVKAILDFLENWKAHMREFFINRMFPEYVKAAKALSEINNAYADWWNNGGFISPLRKEKEKENRQVNREFSVRWNFIQPYITRTYNRAAGMFSMSFDTEKFERDIKLEAERKYDDIIARTNAIVGKIVDASGLCVGDKGDLNGLIIGERGTAKVTTIGAGGYNIQCYHFRTLIHKVA